MDEIIVYKVVSFNENDGRFRGLYSLAAGDCTLQYSIGNRVYSPEKPIFAFDSYVNSKKAYCFGKPTLILKCLAKKSKYQPSIVCGYRTKDSIDEFWSLIRNKNPLDGVYIIDIMEQYPGNIFCEWIQPIRIARFYDRFI